MTKQEIKQREEKLLEMTGAFCAQKLDKDYYQLCEKLIKKLGRKREVPFQRGKLEIWAAAVVYAIGSINFLFGLYRWILCRRTCNKWSEMQERGVRILNSKLNKTYCLLGVSLIRIMKNDYAVTSKPSNS